MSTTVSFIHTMEKMGHKSAKLMLKYKTEPERPLAAILSLNTIANTVGAAGVGRQATLVFGNEWFGLVSAIVTLLILVFSEIIPKTLGTNYWKKLMGFTANTIRVLIIIMYPFVKLIEWVSKIFPDTDATSVSREEVIAIANAGEAEGVIEEDENTIIRNVMSLNDIKASDIMTPRVVAAVAAESMSLQEYYDSDEYDHFSRIPVYSDSPEYITGYVLRDEALEQLTEDHFNKKLGDIKRKIPYFNENKSIDDIFDSMLKQKSHISLIIDEYGCFQGILTMEDIIETIYGLEITDESDVVTDMRQYARERWQQRLKHKTQIKMNRKHASKDKNA